jgi:hypothetical protein
MTLRICRHVLLQYKCNVVNATHCIMTRALTTTPSAAPHQPVLLDEVVQIFFGAAAQHQHQHQQLEHRPTIVDGTFGAGGHSAALLGTWCSMDIEAYETTAMASRCCLHV